MKKPSEFATKYQEWYDKQVEAIDNETDAKKKQALIDELNKEEVTIALKTADMKVSKKTSSAAADSIIDLNAVTNKIVNLILVSKFTAETALNLQTDGNNLWDITLPSTTDAFNLEMFFPNATVFTKSAGSTKLGLVITIASSRDNAYWGDDYGHGSAKIGGLTLGNGISVDALRSLDGKTVIDGATVDAAGVRAGVDYNGYYAHASFYQNNKEQFMMPNVVDADDKDVPLTKVKVFQGNENPWIGIYGSNNPLEQLVIGSGVTAWINWNSVNGTNVSYINVKEIVGAGRDKSEVRFATNVYHANLESISKITVANNGSNLNIYPIIDDCFIAGNSDGSTLNNVNVYPTAKVRNTEIKALATNVVPSVQTAANPTYTFTFEGCTFPYNAPVQCATNVDGDRPVLDGDGNPVTKTRYEYAYLYNGTWYWTWTYDFDEVSTEAKKLDPNGEGKYWIAIEEQVYYSASADKIKDYLVTIGLNNCKVRNSKDEVVDLTKDTGKFNVYTGSYDINLKYNIDGTVYTPVKVKVDEEMSLTHIVLVKD